MMVCVYLSIFFGLLSLVADRGPVYPLLWSIGLEPATFLLTVRLVAIGLLLVGLMLALFTRGNRHV
ncbi:hypothetical protein ACIP1U_11150 [Cupriavidus sp. NPDC089707]|uniref:hypothetical protein n=1 Tax=Cupriavidus sp. NPDC089707 TaxID=3363963 RepID=UPI003802784E